MRRLAMLFSRTPKTEFKVTSQVETKSTPPTETKATSLTSPLIEYKKARSIPFTQRIEDFLAGDESRIYYLQYMDWFYSETEMEKNKQYLRTLTDEHRLEKELTWQHLTLRYFSEVFEEKIFEAQVTLTEATKKQEAPLYLRSSLLGMQRRIGLGIAEDHKKALEHLTEAINLGSIDAHYNLGMLLLSKPFQGHEEATPLLQKAVDSDHPLALVTFAYRFKSTVALDLYSRAAKQGSAPAMHAIAGLLQKEKILLPNENYLDYLHAAAEVDKAACNDLALHYVKTDLIKAIFYYRNGVNSIQQFLHVFESKTNSQSLPDQLQLAIASQNSKSTTKFFSLHPKEAMWLANSLGWETLGGLAEKKLLINNVTQTKTLIRPILTTSSLGVKGIQDIILNYLVDESKLGDPIVEAFFEANTKKSFKDRVELFRKGDLASFTYLANPEWYYSPAELKEINHFFATLNEKSNDPVDKLLCGVAYYYGKPTEDKPKALQFFTEVAETKSLPNHLCGIVNNMIGAYYGSMQDRNTARVFYNKASKLGDPHAMFNLADIDPVHVDNKTEPLDYLLAAAGKNYPPALFALAKYHRIYFLGIDKHLECFERAAKLGHINAIFELARIMAHPKKSSFNTLKIERYLDAAMQKGFASAMILAGDLYCVPYSRDIFNRDLIKAAKLYRQAHETGPSPEAAQRLRDLSANTHKDKAHFAIRFHTAIALKDREAIAKLVYEKQTDALLKEETDPEVIKLFRPGEFKKDAPSKGMRP